MQFRGTYEEAVAYILQIPRFTKKNTPQATGEFYEYLGRPGERPQQGSAFPKLIHVAGTNGKGSVCAYISTVLSGAGYRTGLFVSPHLVDIRERFRMDNVYIGKEDFTACFVRVMDALACFNAQVKRRGTSEYHPTFFEMMFFMGMLWFQKEKAQYIVLETGLGGRLDATNVIGRPCLCVITRIALDHMEYLGDTKEKIATEKAGIIKEGVPVVFWDEDTQVTKVIVDRANIMHSMVIPVSEKQVGFYKINKKCVDFSLSSAYYEYIRVILETSAAYQRQNAALAVRALEWIGRNGILNKSAIEQGMTRTQWEGRMEEIRPGVFLDGAHNEDGVRAFLESVECDGCTGKRYLLFSAVSDKRIKEMTDMLLTGGLFTQVAAAPVENARGLLRDQLEELWQDSDIPVRMYDHVEEGMEALLSVQTKEDRVYAVGSLYLIGQLEAYFNR